MRLFAIIYILFWTGPITVRIGQVVNYDNRVMRIVGILGISLQGFANAIVWMSYPHITRVSYMPLTKESSILSLVFDTQIGDQKTVPRLAKSKAKSNEKCFLLETT
jgi:hypothetical protein